MEHTKTQQQAEYDCYSLNGEDYHSGGIGDALDEMDGDEFGIKVGRTYWLGISKRPEPSSFFDLDRMLEDMQCQACDECGEYAEDFLTYLPPEKKEELRALVSNWLDANVTVGFFSVQKAVERTVTQADFDEHSSARAETGHGK